MTDDKPKHKPQAKRTLEEVLRSLKDLVRNDLPDRRGPGTPSPIVTGPVASDEPESFNEALSRLDEIIDEKIVRPAPVAATAPPPVSADEIEWDDVAAPEAGHEPRASRSDSAGAGPSADTDTAEHEPRGLHDAGPEQERRAAPEIDEREPASDADAAALAALESIELAPLAPEAPPPPPAGTQHAFGFVQAPSASDGSGPHERLDPAEAPVEDGTSPPGPEPQAPVPGPSPRDAAGGMETIEAAPMPGEGDEPLASDDEQAAMSADETRAGPAAPGPAGEVQTRRAEENTRASRPPELEVPPGTAEPPTLEDEIPVLQDVAPGVAPDAGALPDAAHARDIAIRVIARINIERRKAGETPLDIKTIERLQHYLTEALTKAAAGRAR